MLLATTCVCARKRVARDNQKDAHQETAEEDAVCGAGTDTETDTETPSRREPVPARPERDAHQETAEEDAVCGAEAGRMC